MAPKFYPSPNQWRQAYDDDMSELNIEVWSDVVCPWCYIGHRRLHRALTNLGIESKAAITHRAFQLQPDFPVDRFLPTSEHLAAKYKLGPDQVIEMQKQVLAAAETEGLTYHLDNTLSGNTVDAHRVLLWAQDQGHGQDLLMRLFDAYFVKQENFFTHENLLQFVGELGLDVDAARVMLNSDDYEDQVIDEGRMAGQFGASGVPFFVINRKFGISGAQPLEVFESSLTRALEDAQK